MAAEQDAARDRVLAARSEFDASIGDLGASARYAVDIPAQVRRSPAKAAAIVGGVVFLVLRGPQRLWRAFRRHVLRRNAPLPKRLLPKEIEKAIDRMGDDGDKVRGTIERDFADYVKQRQRERRAIPTVILLSAARPIIGAAARRAMEYLTAPPSAGYGSRLEEVRSKAGAMAEDARATAAARTEDARASAERAANSAASTAKERVDTVRGVEEPPTGV